jgi:uncharacterized protein (DUF362 family)
MPTHALVALIRTKPATALDDFERLMELAQLRQRLDLQATTLLRPAVRRHFPFPSANTTPWQLEGIGRALRAAGCHNLAWESPRSRVTSIGAGEDLNGYLPILRAYGVTERCASGAARRDTNLALLPTLTTDATTVIGGALWCLVNQRVSLRCLDDHDIHEQLVNTLAASRESYAGIFAVMDGTTAGAGPGPYYLRPEIRSVLLASADPLALDAVTARLMGFDPLGDVAYLRLAHERGLGIADPQAIELTGDIDLAYERWAFAASGRRATRIPRLLLRVLGSATERFRWIFTERLMFEGWLRGTPWGRLFAYYQRLGYGENHEPPTTKRNT